MRASLWGHPHGTISQIQIQRTRVSHSRFSDIHYALYSRTHMRICSITHINIIITAFAIEQTESSIWGGT